MLEVPGHAVLAYDAPRLRPLGLPLPTQTSVAGDALIATAATVEECLYRMFETDEIRAGMAFTAGYRMFGTKAERMMMLGNAVTPPTSRDLGAAVVEAVTGEPLEAGS